MKTKKKPYPIYNENHKGLKPGLYLGLFNGYRNEKEREKADDWGAFGPLIGPLQFVHTTYASIIHIIFINEGDGKKYGFEDEHDISINKDHCVTFHGMKYGDWTVFNINKE